MAVGLLSTSVQQILSAASGIPTDVKFLFKKEQTCEGMEEVKAHRLILAAVSDVFKKEFYGGFIDDGGIEILDATKESFEAMIEFIYNKQTDVSIYDLDIMCSLFYLGDKYNINALKEEILKAIRGKNFPYEKVVEIGPLADQFSVHTELADTLYEAAAQSLSKKFCKDPVKVENFFTTQLDVMAASACISCKSLVRIMAKVVRIASEPVCGNCKVSPCIKGAKVTRENFVPEAKIIVSGGHKGVTLHSLRTEYKYTHTNFEGVFDGLVCNYRFSSHNVYDC